MAVCPYVLQIILMCAVPTYHWGQHIMTKHKEIGQLLTAKDINLHLPNYSHFL